MHSLWENPFHCDRCLVQCHEEEMTLFECQDHHQSLLLKQPTTAPVNAFLPGTARVLAITLLLVQSLHIGGLFMYDVSIDLCASRPFTPFCLSSGTTKPPTYLSLCLQSTIEVLHSVSLLIFFADGYGKEVEDPRRTPV